MRNLPSMLILLLCWTLVGCGQPIESNPGTRAEENSAAVPSKRPVSNVGVTIKEWGITMEPSAVKSGEVALVIRNAGKEPHGLFVSGPGVDRKGQLLEPGQTETLSVSLTEGDYTLFDFVSTNETDHGMTATLTVK